ncbi:MAG: hypothetical protein H3Z50_00410 [archaeon]|nr:hypothetical protein [archaeon]MCP8305843.1 hypothetical protein [archaeon]
MRERMKEERASEEDFKKTGLIVMLLRIIGRERFLKNFRRAGKKSR